MKIAIIGSTQYGEKFKQLAEDLYLRGHIVKTPAFDHHPDLDELGVCEFNREMIEWADKVMMIWDRRSTGTIFDFGMVFALRKPFEIHYLEPKTFENVMRKYETYTSISKKD
jgi:nucleoside 2-deoxyribosyltransferase